MTSVTRGRFAATDSRAVLIVPIRARTVDVRVLSDHLAFDLLCRMYSIQVTLGVSLLSIYDSTSAPGEKLLRLERTAAPLEELVDYFVFEWSPNSDLLDVQGC